MRRTLAWLRTSRLNGMSRELESAIFATDFGMDLLRDGPAETFLDLLQPVTKAAAHLSLEGRAADPEVGAGEAPAPGTRFSGGAVEQLLGLRLQVQAGVLVRLTAGQSGDALDKVEHACRRMAFLGQHRLDDLRRVAL